MEMSGIEQRLKGVLNFNEDFFIHSTLHRCRKMRERTHHTILGQVSAIYISLLLF